MSEWVPPLPENWESRYHRKHMAYYFINHVKKVTQWEDPRFFPNADTKEGHKCYPLPPAFTGELTTSAQSYLVLEPVTSQADDDTKKDQAVGTDEPIPTSPVIYATPTEPPPQPPKPAPRPRPVKEIKFFTSLPNQGRKPKKSSNYSSFTNDLIWLGCDSDCGGSNDCGDCS